MPSSRKFTLMNKGKQVLDFLYDKETHHVVKIETIYSIAYAPPYSLDHKGDVTKSGLDRWWHERAIPVSRCRIDELLHALGVDSPLVLAEESQGLSLSDRYWINDPEKPTQWKDINYYDNDFSDDLGIVTLGRGSSNPQICLSSPNGTLGGDLSKKWMIENGDRFLVKGGTGFVRQEVYNEVIASALHRRLLDKQDFVAYDLYKEDGKTYCRCKNMLHDNEELIPALHIIHNQKKKTSQNDYQFVVECFEKLGLHDTRAFLSKMFICDYIMGNFDRHYNNFGVIRNVETLEYTRLAPIFDTGNSLWCSSERLERPQDYDYVAKPFGRDGMSPDQQLSLLEDFSWLDPGKLDGFVREAENILAQNPNMPKQRIEKIAAGIRSQIDRFL